MQGISGVAENLLASQEGLCSVKLMPNDLVDRIAEETFPAFGTVNRRNIGV
jgi:hypothetical protein